MEQNAVSKHNVSLKRDSTAVIVDEAKKSLVSLGEKQQRLNGRERRGREQGDPTQPSSSTLTAQRALEGPSVIYPSTGGRIGGEV